MGLKAKLHRKSVYFDTNIFIYLFEGNPALRTPISELQSLIEHQEIKAVANSLIYTELLPPVAKSKDVMAMQTLIDFLGEPSAFTIVHIDHNTCIHAGILRGETGMKTPDAIHVASAIQAKCDIFLTNDKGIQTPQNLEKVIFSD